MQIKRLVLTFVVGMSLVVAGLAWFLAGIGEGDGEAPIAGVAVGAALMIGAVVVGLVNAVRLRSKQPKAD